jgi:hypothetical protein
LTLDIIVGASDLPPEETGFGVAEVEAQPVVSRVEPPKAAARASAVVKFQTRLMVLFLPLSMPPIHSSGVMREEPGTYQPPFASVKPLRPTAVEQTF